MPQPKEQRRKKLSDYSWVKLYWADLLNASYEMSSDDFVLMFRESYKAWRRDDINGLHDFFKLQAIELLAINQTKQEKVVPVQDGTTYVVPVQDGTTSLSSLSLSSSLNKSSRSEENASTVQIKDYHKADFMARAEGNYLPAEIKGQVESALNRFPSGHRGKAKTMLFAEHYNWNLSEAIACIENSLECAKALGRQPRNIETILEDCRNYGFPSAELRKQALSTAKATAKETRAKKGVSGDLSEKEWGF